MIWTRTISFTLLSLASLFPWSFAREPASCERTITVDVVALEQPYMTSRLGTMVPSARMFALREDVVSNDTPIDASGHDVHPENYPLEPGKVRLRAGKRARPLVLRANQGDCLEIRFTNLLSPEPSMHQPRTIPPFPSLQVNAGITIIGATPTDVTSLGSATGANPPSDCKPGDSKTLTWFAAKEGSFLFYSHVGDEEHLFDGLFGMLTVQPRGAEWYRSQVTRDDLALATRGATRTGHPRIDYDAVYPTGHRFAGKPILRLLDDEGRLRYGDLTAIVTGPDAGRFPDDHPSASFKPNPAAPDRHQPYREFVLLYHKPFIIQAFDKFFDPAVNFAYTGAQDNFAINYGMSGLGAEILANRFHVGPMGSPDAVDLKFEEFFLSSWAAGDPGLIVDVPANTPDPTAYEPTSQEASTGGRSDHRKATKVFYPDDPSNVVHSYLGDHVKFRVGTPGDSAPHTHHQHAHQWLHSPNSDESHYKDSQLLTRGAAYTMEMVYGGSGNRNQTVGDALYHCHFYPHFAQGMWGIWRVHDVFERGTQLDEEGRPLWSENGEPIDNRALPDGEITTGTPIPAVVPLPTIAMAPLPARIRLSQDGRRVIPQPEPDTNGDLRYGNPGFPFFIPGLAGARAPHPPMDFATAEDESGNPLRHQDGARAGEPVLLNGGLPRHLVFGGTIVRERHSRWDFTKDFVLYETPENEDDCEPVEARAVAGGLRAFALPEAGTPSEIAAMAAHAQRRHDTTTPDGSGAAFITNGRPPATGAPFADPAVDDDGQATGPTRRYQAANIQMNVVLNKLGWHMPQQRLMTLWYDVAATLQGERPPEPLFYRANSGETVEFWHTNLVPSYYELDDFQIRTPTDILGQHIHLVKFDVTASDGAANGFNYEDGSFSPDEVRDRIHAINREGGLFAWDPEAHFVDMDRQTELEVQAYRDHYAFFGDPPCGQNWDGAQTTVQRWYADPLLNDLGVDRTLRTVLAHDHFSASSHQQAGLYSGLLVEPPESNWFTNGPVHGGDEEGVPVRYPADHPMGGRADGGPTSWQAVIEDGSEGVGSFREFVLAFQDMAPAYQPNSTTSPTIPAAPVFTIPTCNANGCKLEDVACLDAVWCPNPTETAELMAALPLAGTVSSVPEPLRRQFARAGLSLDDEATVHSTASTMDPDGDAWLVEQPLAWNAHGQAILFERYRLVRQEIVCRHGDCGFPPNFVEDRLTGLLVFDASIEPGWSDPQLAVNPPVDLGNPASAPSPMLSNLIETSGTLTVNYRNEPNDIFGEGRLAAGTDAVNRDPGHAFASAPRGDARFDRQPDGPDSPIDDDCASAKAPSQDCFTFPSNPLVPSGEAVSDQRPTDPYTPLMRAYAGDDVHIRTIVAAHSGVHAFALQGLRWFTEATDANSGYRNVQSIGTAEIYDMDVSLPGIEGAADLGNPHPFQDFLWQADSGERGGRHGIWGLLRSFDGQHIDPQTAELPRLPNNPEGNAPAFDWAHRVARVFEEPPHTWPRNFRRFRIRAHCRNIVYNDRGQTLQNSDPAAGIAWQGDDTALEGVGLVYSLVDETDHSGTRDFRHWQGPLMLRAAAGDFIQVVLTNDHDGCLPEAPVVGLVPQRLALDVSHSAGMNIGFNREQTAAPGEQVSYLWYAGTLETRAGTVVPTPVEFGTVNLMPVDMLHQIEAGLVGTLIVEPLGSRWALDLRQDGTPDLASATLFQEGRPSFREFIALYQWGPSQLGLPGGRGGFPSTESYAAYNYRSEPLYYRLVGPAPEAARTSNHVMLGDLNDPTSGDPRIPIFRARTGSDLRVRHPAPGSIDLDMPSMTQVVMIEGHFWQDRPYLEQSRILGFNPDSAWLGSSQFGANEALDILTTAGGPNLLTGDFKIHNYVNDDYGAWALLRVEPRLLTLHRAARFEDGRVHLAGQVWGESASPRWVDITVETEAGDYRRRAPCDGDGLWTLHERLPDVGVNDRVRVTASDGASVESRLSPGLGRSLDHLEPRDGTVRRGHRENRDLPYP
ncbi:hypothetical protein SCOR_11700 [Sulfidibacter corallicola]|uniref:Multicopper oxidase n=1 Tax=Sulfidibacter corallicola TaxID=2818388 RepID=A0A8A4TEM2_SULCO|nr:hypothetical protein [Sulfidibacter corallicola]QTD48000.1 hypothetical protein J3U87_20650 [Sulfidibacter corallicola]